MYKYEVYDEEFNIHSKKDWFMPEDIDSFYEKSVIPPPELLVTEDKYISAAYEFISALNADSFCVCECEVYKEYYGINILKEKYPEIYPESVVELYESIKDNDILTGEDIKVALRLILRGHIWCVLRHKNLEIFSEIPGRLTLLCADIPSKAIENVKKLEIIIKDFQ